MWLVLSSSSSPPPSFGDGAKPDEREKEGEEVLVVTLAVVTDDEAGPPPRHVLEVERIQASFLSTFSFSLTVTAPEDFADLLAVCVEAEEREEEGKKDASSIPSRRPWPEWFEEMLEVLTADDAIRRDHGEGLTVHGRAAFEHVVRRARAMGASRFLCRVSG